MPVQRGRRSHGRRGRSRSAQKCDSPAGAGDPRQRQQHDFRCSLPRPDPGALVMLLLVVNLPSSLPTLESPSALPPGSAASLLASRGAPGLTLGGERVHESMDFDALVAGWESVGVHHHGAPVHNLGDTIRPLPPMRQCRECGLGNVTRGEAGGDKLWATFLCRTCAKKATAGNAITLNQRCEWCTRSANYGPAGGLRAAATRCKTHAWSSDADIIHRRCDFSEGCGVQATYGLLRGLPLFCKTHRAQNHVDVTHRGSVCQSQECEARATHGRPGGGPMTRTHCGKHRALGEVNLFHRLCQSQGCKQIPIFALPTETRARFCSKHRSRERHIDVVHRKCMRLGCVKQPSFGMLGDRKATFCIKHKLEGSVAVVGPESERVNRDWEVVYDALLEFHRSHGHCKLPRYPTEWAFQCRSGERMTPISLRRWLTGQWRSLKQGYLRGDKLERLAALGVEWARKGLEKPLGREPVLASVLGEKGLGGAGEPQREGALRVTCVADGWEGQNGIRAVDTLSIAGNRKHRAGNVCAAAEELLAESKALQHRGVEGGLFTGGLSSDDHRPASDPHGPASLPGGPASGLYDGPASGRDRPASGLSHGPTSGLSHGPASGRARSASEAARAASMPSSGAYDGSASGVYQPVAGRDGPASGPHGPASGLSHGPTSGLAHGPASGRDRPASGGYDGPASGRSGSASGTALPASDPNGPASGLSHGSASGTASGVPPGTGPGAEGYQERRATFVPAHTALAAFRRKRAVNRRLTTSSRSEAGPSGLAPRGVGLRLRASSERRGALERVASTLAPHIARAADRQVVSPGGYEFRGPEAGAPRPEAGPSRASPEAGLSSGGACPQADPSASDAGPSGPRPEAPEGRGAGADQAAAFSIHV